MARRNSSELVNGNEESWYHIPLYQDGDQFLPSRTDILRSILHLYESQSNRIEDLESELDASRYREALKDAEIVNLNDQQRELIQEQNYFHKERLRELMGQITDLELRLQEAAEVKESLLKSFDHLAEKCEQLEVKEQNAKEENVNREQKLKNELFKQEMLTNVLSQDLVKSVDQVQMKDAELEDLRSQVISNVAQEMQSGMMEQTIDFLSNQQEQDARKIEDLEQQLVNDRAKIEDLEQKLSWIWNASVSVSFAVFAAICVSALKNHISAYLMEEIAA